MKIYFIPALLLSSSVSTLAYAGCIKPLDCATLGYTATSCTAANGGIRCPFDASKWHCDVCGADYQYACSGKGYKSGSGKACNGKYTSCACTPGYYWTDGRCKKIIQTTGYCCDGGAAGCGSDASTLEYCIKDTSYNKCQEIIDSCKSFGGDPQKIKCGNGYTAKYECVFCDSTYKYTCTGNKQTGGVGGNCSGKYKSCTCKDGYAWLNGECIAYQGRCCNDNSVSGCRYDANSYNYCHEAYGYDDCKLMQDACKAFGGTTSLNGDCGYYNLQLNCSR